MPYDVPIPFEITRVFVPASNYYKGRDRWVPDMIVMHATEGNRKSVISTFQDKRTTKSTHFMVCKDGEIVQFVATTDTAFGNGILANPTDPTVLSRLPSNPNLYTISIEHELLGFEEPTVAQYAASAALLKFLSAKWKIMLDEKHVIRHETINGLKTCPNSLSIPHVLSICG